MDRTVPSSGNEEINLYLRTYYSLLRSTREVRLRSLFEAHKRMRSALHIHADEPALDMAAFVYAILRIPDCIDKVQLVIMGQSARVFAEHGYPEVETWSQVSAPGRRRRSYFDGRHTLAVYIASRSDIDDLVPILVAYQIERRKLHQILRAPSTIEALQALEQAAADREPTAVELAELAEKTAVSPTDLDKLSRIWGAALPARLLTIAQQRTDIAIRSLAGSLTDYKRATRRWWRNVERKTPPDIAFDERPVYFVSSNTHSLPNMLSGFGLQIERDLDEFLNANGAESLRQEYRDILERHIPSSLENFLYYVLKKYEAVHPHARAARLAHERSVGIYRIPSEHAFDIEVQVFDLSKLDVARMDNRLAAPGMERLAESRALVINIDYPLGMAAYQVLTETARNVDEICGVYIMGKAATLNGSIGDVMIPNVVHDEHSLNTYLFDNCFTADDVAPYLVYGTVMDNQKAITVPGTFLQNEGYMSVFYQEGYTDMEMEAGPYLSGIYEMVRPKRHPYDQIVTLYNNPFPIGILHYASDTPFSKGTNLGTQNLSYFGMDPTYAATVAILRAILQTEIGRLEIGD